MSRLVLTKPESHFRDISSGEGRNCPARKTLSLKRHLSFREKVGKEGPFT